MVSGGATESAAQFGADVAHQDECISAPQFAVSRVSGRIPTATPASE